MHLKKFEASNTKEALVLVKEEFGENAVILSTKTLDAGTDQQRIQVMAALDSDLEAAASSGQDPSPQKMQHSPSSNSNTRPSRPAGKSGTQAPRHTGSTAKPQVRQSRHYSPPEAQTKAASKSVSSVNRGKNTNAEPSPSSPEKKPTPEEITRWRDELISRVQTSTLQVDSSGYPVILSLIGPTGSGKTTTAAKLAAWYGLKEGYKVALLSMDCYRIGATDQLRTYARIMRMPCEVAMHKADLTRLITKYQHYDIIIIDTAGKSPYDHSHIEELEDWFSTVPGLRPYLVLSATTKKEDLKHALEIYSCLGNAGLILSKLDETRSYAKLCQQVASSDLPVSYLTTGQKVPEDFVPASRSVIEGLFKKGWPAVQSARDNLAGVVH
ncbi:MAG: flagellar biosynthesis protein FlhF [Desulfurivibrionaceae bacterium]